MFNIFTFWVRPFVRAISFVDSTFGTSFGYRMNVLCDAHIDFQPFKDAAATVREVARQAGLDHFPLILDVSQPCPACHEDTLLIVRPIDLCCECWIDRLESVQKDVRRIQWLSETMQRLAKEQEFTFEAVSPRLLTEKETCVWCQKETWVLVEPISEGATCVLCCVKGIHNELLELADADTPAAA